MECFLKADLQLLGLGIFCSGSLHRYHLRRAKSYVKARLAGGSYVCSQFGFR